MRLLSHRGKLYVDTLCPSCQRGMLAAIFHAGVLDTCVLHATGAQGHIRLHTSSTLAVATERHPERDIVTCLRQKTTHLTITNMVSPQLIYLYNIYIPLTPFIFFKCDDLISHAILLTKTHMIDATSKTLSTTATPMASLTLPSISAGNINTECKESVTPLFVETTDNNMSTVLGFLRMLSGFLPPYCWWPYCKFTT